MEKKRCGWCDLGNPLYVRYHDEEWGVPCHDDQRLFELLLLETFQAGLSWATILNKRENFRRALDGFDPVKLTDYGEEKLTALMADPGIVRNRKKLEAARTNAKVFLMIQEEQGSFDRYLWGFTGGVPVVDDSIPPLPLSKEVSRDLKRRGMRFVGETTVHAFLQAAGVINAHEAGCFRRGERK